MKLKSLFCMPFLSAMVALSSLPASAQGSGDICVGYGPQTPRDINVLEGNNPRVFSLAPDHQELNLCNIHFHAQAEHRGPDFSVFAGPGAAGGYQCNASSSLTPAQLAPVSGDVCGGIVPGDTIEVHWVFSSCNVAPGEGLGSCLSPQCANPDLRVETQVFMVVNDANAMDFNAMSYTGSASANGTHQPAFIPNTTGAPVEFLGSTTGPSYNDQVCSPLQVTWSVRPQCASVDINSLKTWCEANPFNEVKAHGVRKLVEHPDLLSPIN